MHCQRSLTLCWHSIIGGSDIVSRIFANKGGQWIDYESTPMHSVLGVNDARPEIVDTPLTLIEEGGSHIVAAISTHTGVQYFDYTLCSHTAVW